MRAPYPAKREQKAESTRYLENVQRLLGRATWECRWDGEWRYMLRKTPPAPYKVTTD
ncbi:hypothetical protein GCM10027288_16780 [Bordetella tumbae]